MKRIYLDHAAGRENPNSIHTEGREARATLDHARQIVANYINAKSPDQIIFAPSASLANHFLLNQFDHVIVSPIEHQSILNHPNIRGFLAINKLGRVVIENLQTSGPREVVEEGLLAPTSSHTAATAIREDGLARERIPEDRRSEIFIGLSSFSGLPHRLKFVREVAGVKYYDDSYSTMPSATIAAIKAFPNQPKNIILGGSPKGADFSELAQAIKNNNVKHAILVGPEGEKIQTALDAVGYTAYARVFEIPFNMKNIVNITTKVAEPGDIVILSPAAASFDSFKNYSERGNQFIASVEAL